MDNNQRIMDNNNHHHQDLDENQLLHLLGARTKLDLIKQHYNTQPLYPRLVQLKSQPVVLTPQQLPRLPPQQQQKARLDQQAGVYILATTKKPHIHFVAGGPCIRARPEAA